MKKIPFEEHLIKKINISFKTKKKIHFKKICEYIIFVLFIFIINDLILIFVFKENKNKNQNNIINTKSHSITNIDFNDEFFQLKEVYDKVTNNNLTFINTISGGKAKVGNALIILNNLINICEKIGCKNIISPEGLQDLIKRPVFYKKYNITIFPNRYKNMIKIDINLSTHDSFYFHYRLKSHEMRLDIIKQEVIFNIPIYNSNPNDLFIHIRSGDIFLNCINPNYAQPPLCFYQKIIKQFKFNNIYILSNGRENPVIDELIKLYPKIVYTNGTLVEDISKIIYAYNLVKSVSTFIGNLIRFNINLKKLFVYETSNYKRKNNNYTSYTIYKMEPSSKYIRIMKRRWKKTKEQLDLMLNENCSNDKLFQYKI